MPEENEPAGVPEGTILQTTTHEGETVHEKIVHDADGGWHKEVVSNG